MQKEIYQALRKRNKDNVAFTGTAGQPLPWRPTTPAREEAIDKRQEKEYNKGIRSEQAIETRKIKRSIKRKIARRNKTKEKATETKNKLIASISQLAPREALEATPLQNNEQEGNRSLEENQIEENITSHIT